MSGTDIAYAAMRALCDVRPHFALRAGAICLRACYAMSSTDISCGAIGLRACYKTSGTDAVYGATRPSLWRYPPFSTG
eukprot:3239419-Rhodomonas_salina.2